MKALIKALMVEDVACEAATSSKALQHYTLLMRLMRVQQERMHRLYDRMHYTTLHKTCAATERRQCSSSRAMRIERESIHLLYSVNTRSSVHSN
jgi:hypothetical protein